MCCCEKPIVNGEMGYRWQPNDAPSVRQVNAPEIQEDDNLLYDEPGRCGGCDAHSHHFRLVARWGSWCLLVRHGGGDERIQLSCVAKFMPWAEMDSTVRYWTLHTIYSAHNDGARAATQDEAARWRKAAAEKRIRTRKQRGEDRVKVWIEAEVQG